MGQRRLGSTGGLGQRAMPGHRMFGEWGTKDHDQSIQSIQITHPRPPHAPPDAVQPAAPREPPGEHHASASGSAVLEPALR